MIITCSQCQAKFKVAPEQIKESGSKVRCSNCRLVFTVFRPVEPVRASDYNNYLNDDPEPQPNSTRGSGGNPGGRGVDDYGLGDFFNDSAPTRKSFSDSPKNDDSDQDFADDDYAETNPETKFKTPEEQLSLKERRDRRRRLYSDLAGEANLATPDDDDEDLFDDDGGPVDGGFENPPLRRSSKSKTVLDQETEEDDFTDYEPPADDQQLPDDRIAESEDDEYDDYDDEGLNEYDLPSATDKNDRNLGLAANPVESPNSNLIDDTKLQDKGFFRGSGLNEPGGGVGGIRPAITKVPKRTPKALIIGMVVLAILLGIGIYFIAGRQAPTALSSGEGQTDVASTGTENAAKASTDGSGTDGITFTPNQQQHYFYNNAQSGQILVITGMVRNSYPEARCFIRLRGHLLSADGSTLADRYVYAGNILSEEELTTLPMNEIVQRLNIKGGQNMVNTNIEPNKEIPFMLVFDKLPDAMAEYRIDPVGSSKVE